MTRAIWITSAICVARLSLPAAFGAEAPSAALASSAPAASALPSVVPGETPLASALPSASPLAALSKPPVQAEQHQTPKPTQPPQTSNAGGVAPDAASSHTIVSSIAASPVPNNAERQKLPRDILKMRDPFKRIVVNNPNEAPKSDLELIPVEKFKMIGVLTGKGLSKMRAILQGPNGKSYFVSENMRIGVRKGVIRKITPQTLLVRETVINIVGEEEAIDREIKIPTDSKTTAGAAW